MRNATETPDSLKELTERAEKLLEDLLADIIVGESLDILPARIISVRTSPGKDRLNVHVDSVVLSNGHVSFTGFGDAPRNHGLELWWVTVSDRNTELEFRGHPTGQTFQLYLAVKVARQESEYPDPMSEEALITDHDEMGLDDKEVEALSKEKS